MRAVARDAELACEAFEIRARACLRVSTVRNLRATPAVQRCKKSAQTGFVSRRERETSDAGRAPMADADRTRRGGAPPSVLTGAFILMEIDSSRGRTRFWMFSSSACGAFER